MIVLLLLAAVVTATPQLDFGGEFKGDFKKVIFFEKDHYINKATERGFCDDYCGSVRSEIVRKPGRCPAIQPGPQRGLCEDECTYDSECPRSQRCCNDGCSNVCVEPDFLIKCEDLRCEEGRGVYWLPVPRC